MGRRLPWVPASSVRKTLLSISNYGGALVTGAPPFEGGTVKAKVLRGVYVRGKAYGEGAIVDLSPQEFSELKHTNYVVAAPVEAPRAPEPVASGKK